MLYSSCLPLLASANLYCDYILVGIYYESKPFLYNVNTPDFQSFITKLPEETLQKIKFDSFDFFREVIRTANLNLKMVESQAYGILSALLSTIHAKETLSVTCDYFAVFDFMADSLVSEIFM